MVRWRETALLASMSLWGFAIAVALVSVWTGPATPGQLPSYATAINLDSRAPLRFVLGLILLPLALPYALRPVVRRLAAIDSQRWAVNGAGWSSVVALWLALLTRDVFWVIVPCAIAIGGCLLLRHHDARFTRRDIVLLPAVLAAFTGLIDAANFLTLERALVVAAALVFAIRIAISFIPSQLPPALAFLISPLAFVTQTSFFGRDQRYFGWYALIIVLLTPFPIRLFMRNERRAIILLAFVIYPIACYSYLNATSITTAEGKPRINFFEDAHHLVPASEMLRGEKLYRDVVPTHGFVEDAALTWAGLRLRGGTTAGAALRARFIFATLTAVGVYGLATAMTGSIEAGVLAFFLASMLGAVTPTVRIVPSLAALTVLALAVRSRNARLFVLAGAGTVLALTTSLDFGGYTLLTTLLAVARFRGERVRALRNAMLGAVIAGLPFAAALAVYGVLGDFFRVTLRELPTATTTGTLNIFTAPAGFQTFGYVPELLAAILLKPSYLFVIWAATAILCGVALTRQSSRRIEPLVITAFWIVIAALSYAMRHHLFFEFATAPLVIGVAWVSARRWPALTPFIVIAILMIAQPTTHVAIVNWLRQSRGPLDPGWTEIAQVRRAQGVLFTSADAAVVRSVQRYVNERMSTYDTFFDFTDRSILYFLLRRDCPIRQVAVPFYETEELQRQVIAEIERNEHVAAALVPADLSGAQFDGVPNQIRAPLVWQYLQAHFEPDFQEGSVVFWRRKH